MAEARVVAWMVAASAVAGTAKVGPVAVAVMEEGLATVATLVDSVAARSRSRCHQKAPTRCTCYGKTAPAHPYAQ